MLNASHINEDPARGVLGECRVESASSGDLWWMKENWDGDSLFLEDWADRIHTLRDSLGGRLLAEPEVHQMASETPHQIPFKLIPFFEYRQLIDFAGLCDPSAAALLAYRMAALDSLLSLRRDTTLDLCREAQTAATIGSKSWNWLVFLQPMQGMGWPDEHGIRELSALDGGRPQRALEVLRAAATARQQEDPSDAEALSTLEAFHRLDRERAQSLAETTEAATAAATLSVLHSTKGTPAGPQQTYERVCRELLALTVDIVAWKEVAEDCIRARDNPGAQHPLTFMANFLAAQPISPMPGKDIWEKLVQIFKTCDGLLDALDLDGFRPLPALQFAACIRPEVSIGQVAVDLAVLAGGRRTQKKWWQAVRQSLQPTKRLGGVCFANDRIRLAEKSVLAAGDLFSQQERQALRDAFV